MLRPKQQPPRFDTALQVPQRNPFFPQMALRRRSNEHPVVMFALIAVCAIGSMALSPSAGTAFVSSGTQAAATPNDEVRTTAKTSRLTPASDIDVACRGQAWGAESPECLRIIVMESGHEDARKIRMIADAGPIANTPNIF